MAQRSFGAGETHGLANAGAEHRAFGGGEEHRAFSGSGVPRTFGGGEERRAFGGLAEHRAFGGAENHAHFGDSAGAHAAEGHFLYRGHEFETRHGDPYRWPHGYGYHRYEAGRRLPRAFWDRNYYYHDYAAYGLDPPAAGFQWLRYGPDLLLVNMGSGEISQSVHGAWE